MTKQILLWNCRTTANHSFCLEELELLHTSLNDDGTFSCFVPLQECAATTSIISGVPSPHLL